MNSNAPIWGVLLAREPSADLKDVWQLIEGGFKSREQQDGEGKSEAQA